MSNRFLDSGWLIMVAHPPKKVCYTKWRPFTKKNGFLLIQRWHYITFLIQSHSGPWFWTMINHQTCPSPTFLPWNWHCPTTRLEKSPFFSGVFRLDLRLGSRVAAIRWSSSGVRVKLATGAELRGRCAVVTVPLACLEDLQFHPALPERKRGKMWQKWHGENQPSLYGEG